MDKTVLAELANGGFEGVPPQRFYDLSSWCRDWCVSTGDGRFCEIATLLRMIFDAFGEQGLPTATAELIDAALRRELPHILSATDAGSGAKQARSVSEDISRILANTR